MSKPTVIVIGFIGKLPFAGMSLYNIHYIAGLQDLGYDVHYVEKQNSEEDCYDPDLDSMTADPSCAIRYLENLLPHYGIERTRYSFIDRMNNCWGSGWKSLDEALDRAEFVLSLCDPAWFDELERCPQRAFVDGDPMFTQVEMLEGKEKSSVLRKFNILFTYATRMGKEDCSVPDAGRTWIPTTPVVATRLWNVETGGLSCPITTVMHWGGGADFEFKGQMYGHKGCSFERFIQLPKHVQEPFALAIGGSAPRDELEAAGWQLVSPLAATRTISAYKTFIRESRADFGIAKHAYVASRSGWFSDRSTCYLASGRPVLHQDTGFGDLLPTGDGVLSFSSIDDIRENIRRINSDYAQHCIAARSLAEEYFESSNVIGKMLLDAGLR